MKQKVNIQIPDDLDFADLKLIRLPRTGQIQFDWAPIDRICKISGIDPQIFRKQHEDNVAGLIVAWYSIHLENGGAHDQVADEIIAEVADEDRESYERRN